jgi:hypothetical protein
MKPMESQVAQLLLNSKLLDQFQYQAVVERQAQIGGAFHLLVIELGIVGEEKAMQALARVSNIPLVALEKMKVDPRAVACLPGVFCKQHRVFPCALRDGGKSLWLAMADPLDQGVLQAARKQFGVGAIRPLTGLPTEIDSYIQAYYGAELQDAAASPFAGAGIDLSLTPEEEAEDFKITDMSGNTLVKHRAEMAAEAARAQAAQAAIPARVPSSPPPLTPAERLERLERNQEKATRIIRVLAELLVEKGFFTPDEYRGKVK